jgi:hypothetical protein
MSCEPHSAGSRLTRYGFAGRRRSIVYLKNLPTYIQETGAVVKDWQSPAAKRPMRPAGAFRQRSNVMRPNMEHS